MLFFIHNVNSDGGAANDNFDALSILQTMHKDGLKFYYLNSYVILFAHRKNEIIILKKNFNSYKI